MMHRPPDVAMVLLASSLATFPPAESADIGALLARAGAAAGDGNHAAAIATLQEALRFADR